MIQQSGKKTALFVFLATVVLLFVVMIANVRLEYGFEMIESMADRLNTHMPTPVFMALLVVLPIFGFPSTPFLVVLGMKFNIPLGTALLALIIPVHLFISYILAGLIGKVIKKVLAGRGYHVPGVPPHLRLRFSFLVAMTPVAPYAVKNYLLPLAGIPFRSYLGIAWPCQLLLAIPLIVLGNSIMDMNAALLSGAIIAFAVIYLVISRIEKKMEKQVNLKTTME